MFAMIEVGRTRSKRSDPRPRKWDQGVALDFETRRKRQQKLMVQMVERKVRSRAQQLYESRGQTEGQHLQDWFQAESEVLGNSILAPLYRRLLSTENSGSNTSVQATSEQPSPCETGA